MYTSFTLRFKDLSYKQDRYHILKFLRPIQPRFNEIIQTNNLQTIIECQSYFVFQLPSVKLSEKLKRFDTASKISLR